MLSAKLRPPLELDDNTLLRVDFVREVGELLQEVCSEHDKKRMNMSLILIQLQTD